MYPTEIKTLGDHIRKRRLDLGLFQKQVAKFIGVTTSTVTNWEKNRNKPECKHYPKITDFLGYCPYEQLESIGERLRRNRFYLGKTQAEMAEMLNVDPTTLSRWERNISSTSSRYYDENPRLARARLALLKSSIELSQEVPYIQRI